MYSVVNTSLRAKQTMWRRWALQRALRWRATLALACALGVLCVRLPRGSRLVEHFPELEPRRLAHFLADFTNYPRLYPHFGTWRIVEEESNLSTWRYVVTYECGARCVGRAELSAHDELAPHAHRTRLHDTRCTPWLPWLHWPHHCEELEVESVVRAAVGGGAVLEESARVWCGALRLAAGSCAPRPARPEHARALRDALADTAR